MRLLYVLRLLAVLVAVVIFSVVSKKMVAYFICNYDNPLALQEGDVNLTVVTSLC